MSAPAPGAEPRPLRSIRAKLIAALLLVALVELLNIGIYAWGSRQPADPTVSLIAWSTFLLTALVGGVLLLIALRRLLGTVSALREGAERIGAGDLDHRIHVRSGDELATVAASFNAMAERLRQRNAELEERTVELRDAMEAAEMASRAKSQFLANTSHELRTPLNAIIGYSEMLIEEAGERGHSDFTPDLQKIRSSGLHLLHLINDVLDLSRVEAGHMELQLAPVDLDALIEEVTGVVRPLVERRGNRLELHLPARLGRVQTDAVKLRQILRNLLSNAAKFTDQGTVTFEAALQREGEQGRLHLRVADTGVGMSAAQLAQLFQPFMHGDSVTSREGGTGLGLTITERFVDLLGGTLSVESEPAVGTSFSIVLPIVELPDVPGDPGRADEREMPTASNGEAATVLVVEDDPATRERLRRGLTRGGLKVVEAEDGGAALDRLRDRAPGLILLDLLMPHVDGFQFIDRIAGEVQWRSIPVIVLTAKDITEEDRARLGGRVVKVLRKAELPGDELIREVRRALQAQDPAPAVEAPPPGTRGRP